MPERRPTAHQRMGPQWAKRRAAALAAAAARQAREGRPGGPWCECEVCEVVKTRVRYHWLPGLIPHANTVDHITPRRRYPLHLQHSEGEGGADHPTNLRVMNHAHHSRRAEDKARGRKRV
jgi:hypothetical protein